MRVRKRLPALALAFALAFALAGAAHTAAPAEYSARPIRFLVPSPPGGSPDIVARIVAARLAQRLNQQVIVDNRAGASGVIGVEIAKHAAPDGHTLLLATATSFASLPALAKLRHDTVRATRWELAEAGMHVEERVVEDTFRYWIVDGTSEAPLAEASLDVLSADSDDRRRQRQRRHVWDIL